MVQTFAATSKKKYEVMGFEQIILPLYIVVFFFSFCLPLYQLRLYFGN